MAWRAQRPSPLTRGGVRNYIGASGKDGTTWHTFSFMMVSPWKARSGASSGKVQQEDIIKDVKRHSYYLRTGREAAPQAGPGPEKSAEEVHEAAAYQIVRAPRSRTPPPHVPRKRFRPAFPAGVQLFSQGLTQRIAFQWPRKSMGISDSISRPHSRINFFRSRSVRKPMR